MKGINKGLVKTLDKGIERRTLINPTIIMNKIMFLFAGEQK